MWRRVGDAANHRGHRHVAATHERVLTSTLCVSASLTAEDVKQIEKKDEFDPNAYYVSLTSHAEQFGVDPVRIRVRIWRCRDAYLRPYYALGCERE